MEFKKFSSLDNTYRQNLIERVEVEGLSGEDWIVTEKIHGANFSFWCDGVSVQVASRTQFVDGTFFNCQSVINKYENNIMELQQKTGGVVVVYGELFGGNIQKEVTYGEKDFRAFDLVVDGVIMNKLQAIENLESVKIPCSPVIKVANFKDCLEVPNSFKSLLTPEDYEGENTAEGVVIEPVNPKWFSNGSRVYFKNKTESFSEKKQRVTSVEPNMPEEITSILINVGQYITEQRVDNVVSKMGIVTNKDFGKILGNTIKDVFEEYEKEYSVSLKKVVDEHWKMFNKKVTNEVSKVVRPVFLKHLEE
tara:strand:+ start:78634 stop:79554 length:921 start_codon:yes stop_codon:yes gene_type:complete